MNYAPGDVTWQVMPAAAAEHRRVHYALGPDVRKATVDGLKELLCLYFSNGDCHSKRLNISPMGEHSGGRCFKVRFAVPGGGKSGGLRLAVVAFCPERRVVIANAWARSTDPGDGEFDDAFKSVS